MNATSGVDLATHGISPVNTFTAMGWAMIRLARPHMFVAGALLYGIGVALAASYAGSVDLGLAFSGLLAVFFGQISGQIANDYWDMKGDDSSRRTFFSGGSGILTRGILRPQTALKGAIVSCAFAALLGIIIVLWYGAGIFTVPIILGGTLGGWLYSAEPIRLVSTGLGEVVVSGIVSYFPIVAGFYIQTGTLALDTIIVGALLTMFLFPVFLSVEFPDYDADERSRKRNLLVRFGLRSTTRLYAATMLLPYLVLFAFVSVGWITPLALVVLATIPIAMLGASRALTLSRADFKGAAFVTMTSMVVIVMTMALMLFSLIID